MESETPKRRPRLTFDVDDSLLSAIDEAAANEQETIREWCVQAIREALEPGLRFHAPRPRKPISLRAFLADAEEGIAMAGTTLHSLQDPELVSFLCEKLDTDGITMRFVMIDPEIDAHDPVYQLLSKRYAHQFEKADLKAELRKTAEALGRVYHHGIEAGCTVRILGIRTLPMTGLTIVDPYSARTKLRVALYLHMHPQELHPFFEVDARSPAGKAAGQAFLQHFDLLTDGARLIFGSL